MSATNKTTYYELPIFIGTDTPSWLGDWNNTMTALDTALNNIHTEAQSAQNTANSAQSATDANTENLAAANKEMETLKKAVQNYDSILNFNEVPVITNPVNQPTNKSKSRLIQNTNKTISKMMLNIKVANSISDPVVYPYTGTSGEGSSQWLDLFTIEDNCFNLNQGSQPSSSNSLTLAFTTGWTSNTDRYPLYLRAWFDGATTHIGFSGYGSSIPYGLTVYTTFPVFLTGNVFVDKNPGTE